MSQYLSIDGGEPRFLASNTGWGDFVRWADGLDLDTFPLVAHLADHGYAPDVPEMTKQLAAALKDHRPDRAAVAATATGLLELLRSAKGADVVAVTDGISAGGDE